MFTRKRSLIGAMLSAIVTLGLTTGTAAATAQSPNGCSQYGTVIPFVLTVPDSIRSIGTHGYEFLSTWTPEGAGDPGTADNPNTVTFDSSAPLYPDTAWLRPFFLQVEQPDGSVSFDVTTLNPGQQARFGIAWFPAPGDKLFASSLQVSLRWETSPGTWTAWVAMPKGPQTSVCAPGGPNHYGGFFKEAWGWAG